MNLLSPINLQAASTVTIVTVSAAITGWVNPLSALAFALVSNVVDRVANVVFGAKGRDNPLANSNKQICRFVVTLAVFVPLLGIFWTAIAFLLNQGAIMLSNRLSLHVPQMATQRK